MLCQAEVLFDLIPFLFEVCRFMVSGFSSEDRGVFCSYSSENCVIKGDLRNPSAISTAFDVII